MRNPFRNRQLAFMFETCLRVAGDNFSEFYVVPRRPRWHGPNVPRRGAAHRHSFWNGYNDAPINWDSYGRQSLSYAAFRAGRAFRRR
jgi:hypothetical protein